MKTEKKLFGNVSGNQFRLLTESIDDYDISKDITRIKPLQEGIKKIFSNGKKEISYKNVSNIGMGYIKDVTQARKCALYEAKELASQYGYKDDEAKEKFIKEDGEMGGYDIGASENGYTGIQHSGKKTSHQNEESREVEIGKEILAQISKFGNNDKDLIAIEKLAQELIDMHGSNV